VPAKKETLVEVDGRQLALTNLDKVLYPATGTTKGDTIAYLRAVAGVMLPHLAGRPVTRKRWPNGVDGLSFFAKDLDMGTPGWLERVQVDHSSAPKFYPVASSLAALVWFGQSAALELHVPQWRFAPSGPSAHGGRSGGVHRGGTQRHPDRVVFDLDPGPRAGLAECVEVAFLVKERLGALGQRIVPVTSGSKGMHLYVPLPDPITSEDASAWARQVAEEMQKALPRLVVWRMTKALREGKVFFDWSQNAAAKTTIAPYSMRGREHPMVAAPRTWDELAAGGLAHLDYRQVMDRVAAGIDPLGELHGPRTLAARSRARSAPITTARPPVTKAVPDVARPAAAKAQPPARRMPHPVTSSSNLPLALSPMLASPGRVEMVTEPALWRWEGKWDGMRALAFVVGSDPSTGEPGGLSVRSRIGRDNTAAFPELWELPELLAGHTAVLDGEIVCFDRDGRTDFGMMQQRMGQTRASVIAANSKRFPASFLVFDVLHLDGISLLAKRYDDRRKVLAALPLDGEHCSVPEQMTGTLADAMARTEAAHWEGIVGKRFDSTYTPGARTKAWVKVKHLLSMEAVIVGWQPGQGGRTDRIGSLVMAVPNTDEAGNPAGGWRFVGKVGTGFTVQALRNLASELAPLRRDTPPLDTKHFAAEVRGVRWVQPVLVGEVAYAELTAAGGTFRHPRWRGRRYDKVIDHMKIPG
jgi:bifunctional non-homologous end joining protein LigD